MATGAGSRLDASATFDASTIEGTDVGAGSTGRFNNLDGVLRYGFTGHVAHADVQRWGRALDLPSISGDDYASSFTGTARRSTGRASSLDTLVLDATGAARALDGVHGRRSDRPTSRRASRIAR